MNNEKFINEVEIFLLQKAVGLGRLLDKTFALHA